MTFHNNGSAIGVGVAIFVVVIIIIIVVAFGCNGGWFNRNRNSPQAYVALAQKSKDDEVLLAQADDALECAPPPADNSTQTTFDSNLYDQEMTVDKDSKRENFDPKKYFPKAEKEMEHLSGGTDHQDTTALDTNKITVSELKQRYALQGQIGRFMVNTRMGATRILGMGSSLLRPWHEDFVSAQKRACARRERTQGKECDDDSCVQFNESSFMYDACDI